MTDWYEIRILNNMKFLTLWPWPQGIWRDGEGAVLNFRPVSNIVHQYQLDALNASVDTDF